MAFNFGKPAASKYQSMVSDSTMNQNVLDKIQTYNLNIQEAVQVAQNATNIMQAYIQLFKNKSFNSVFYNYNAQKEEFQKVNCSNFEDLQKKTEQQEKDIKRLGCISNILDKALLQIQDQRGSNKAFLKDILMRQIQINISIINKLKANPGIDDKQLFDSLVQARDNLQQSPNKVNSYQLKTYLDTENEVLYQLLQKIQGYL